MRWALLYLGAIIVANISVAVFGPASTPINAFLLIGAVLTLRDKLHEEYGPRVVLVLVPLGTLLSLVFGPTVAKIALAGAVAFAGSELADTAIYHGLRGRPWLYRVNVSNTVGAVVDSILFPVLAFGGFPIWIIILQFVAKTLGGSLWALALNKMRSVPDTTEARITPMK